MCRCFVMRLLFAAAVAGQTLAIAAAAKADDAVYSVGVGKVDITPSYPVRLNGFGFRRAESEGVTQRIFAKALAIGSDEERPLVLVTLDSTGIRLAMIDEVAARLREKAGVERERFAVTFTHTHTAPKVNGVCDTVFSSPIPAEHQAHIDRYTRELADAIEQVALAALEDRRPARLSWAKGTVGFARNRRTPGGPVDHDLPLLVVKSADDGTIRAIWVSYACHCVTLSDNKISGDWAGFAQAAMERNHPGAVALVSIGCGSDANPDSGVTGANHAVAAEQGGQIAAEVGRLLRGPLHTISGSTEATMGRIDLPLNELSSRAELEKLAAADNPAGYNAKYQLAKLDRGEALEAEIEYPVQVWSFGDSLSMVFLGGEICVDYSLRLKRELDRSRVWIHGYANEMCSYIPSERLAREGGYGGGAETVYFALPATLRAGLEDKIIDEVHRQVPDRFNGKSESNKNSAMQSLSPAESLATIHVGEDLTVELMAAEPLVVSPVAIDFGPDGRLWVAEMRDYSRGVDEKFEQTGQVTVLGDSDGDGSLDTSAAFATGLRFPTDVKAWRKGVIVCDAPEVIYLEDTDGDGRADLRRTLLTGFATHNAQARVNCLRWGLDGWLYGSCGLFGGDIKGAGGEELALGSRDFRFQPDSGRIEAVTGRTQQGRARDDWQNWFGCENGSLLNHYPLTDRYLARNPHIAPPADEVFVPSGGDANKLFPLGNLVLFKESGPPGRPTSACGLEIYRDELFGADYRGNAFVAEPVNQLVHRQVLTPRGVTFAGQRADGESHREFLASTDQWFRPVQIRTGPDGALWIVDMHRLVIEHPRFIPQETMREIDVMAGNTTGRIFRVRPRRPAPRPWMSLDQLDVPSLVAALDSPNGPQRDMVQQILMQRGAREAQSALEQLFASSNRAEVRLQALYTLSGLEVLKPGVVCRALQDSNAAIRRHAVQLSEPFLAANAEVAAAVLERLNDGDAQVQMQLAYSLGEWNDPRGAVALAQIARSHAGDPYILSAALSSASRENTTMIVHEILSHVELPQVNAQLVDGLIILVSKYGDASTVGEAFTTFTRAEGGVVPLWQLKAAGDLLWALGDDERRKLLSDTDHRDDVARLAGEAESLLRDPTADEVALKAALHVVIAAAPSDEIRRDTVAQMLGPQNPPTVQRAAVDAIAESNAIWGAELLLENWARYTPAVRDRTLAYFFERESLLPALLSAIQSGEVNAIDLDALERQQLLTHANRGIRDRAIAVLAGAINANRTKVIADYAEVRELAGDVVRGRELFGRHCASCHKMEGQGHAVGPDLAALTSRSIPSLLESLLHPNRAIDERYQSYMATTDEGLVYTGILVRENATSITLLEQQGKERVLLRGSLDDLVNTQISLMPEGLERDLSKQDVADVLAYVAANGEPPKQFPERGAE